MRPLSLLTGTKFCLLFFFTLTLTVRYPSSLEMMGMGLLVFLFCRLGRRRGAAKLILSFLLLTLLNRMGSEAAGVMQVLQTWALIIRRFLVPFGLGWVFVKTTKVSALLAWLEKLRLPTAIIVPLVVMFRYFPVLKDEYGYMKDALKVRGLEPGWRSLKSPALSLEYLLVPLMFSTANIGEELSQAAFSKGVGIEGKKHRYDAGKLSFGDLMAWLYLAVCLYVLVKG